MLDEGLLVQNLYSTFYGAYDAGDGSIAALSTITSWLVGEGEVVTALRSLLATEHLDEHNSGFRYHVRKLRNFGQYCIGGRLKFISTKFGFFFPFFTIEIAREFHNSWRLQFVSKNYN